MFTSLGFKKEEVLNSERKCGRKRRKVGVLRSFDVVDGSAKGLGAKYEIYTVKYGGEEI